MTVRADSEEARFDELYRETRKDLLAYLLRRAGSREDAADALSETFLIAWRKLGSIPAGPGARLWLFGVARNVLRKGATQTKTRDALLARLALELREPHSTRPGDNKVSAALAALSDRDRELLMLAAWEGLTPQEIATVMGASANAIRIRLHRARTRFRAKFTEPEPGPDQEGLRVAPDS